MSSTLIVAYLRFQVVFTDNGSKDLKLKDEILRIKKKKELEIYIVLTPDYEGRDNDDSIRVNLSFFQPKNINLLI